MKNKKTLVMASWALIAVVFVILLGIVWFNNQGLEVDIQTTESRESFAVVVSNQSNHTIRQVSVKQEEGGTREIGKIASLKPRQIQEFLIPVQESRITIEVSAPFHITAEKSIFIPKPEPFTVEVQEPDNPTVDQNFDVIVKACNNSNETQVEATETHDPTFFDANSQTRTAIIPKGECQNLSFRFLPVFIGPTIVIFNIKSNTLSTQIEKELVIGR